ncbi:Uncharacterized protein GBIM_07061 [Gryllus bimaculatus]|nr:Uncharacterized protein GBIM_07061 [Gryllus bimaculatus]
MQWATNAGRHKCPKIDFCETRENDPGVVRAQELELRIETQKQTLAARDESIKKLLEMLQNKGVGGKMLDEERVAIQTLQARLIESEDKVRHYETLVRHREQELCKTERKPAAQNSGLLLRAAPPAPPTDTSLPAPPRRAPTPGGRAHPQQPGGSGPAAGGHAPPRAPAPGPRPLACVSVVDLCLPYSGVKVPTKRHFKDAQMQLEKAFPHLKIPVGGV